MQQRIDNPLHPLHRTRLARATLALLAASAFAFAPHAQARTFISVNIAPPPLPVYEQPDMPGPGYLWTPGYWAWDGDVNDYYWVPGTWVHAPYVGALWTPGYWGWNNNAYYFHSGYWGRHVGYYGGINYGFGYIGIGYVGGYWNHGGFYYNREYNRFGNGLHIHIYDRRVPGDVAVNRFSFNGPGGWDRRPTREELRFEHERHSPPSAEQREHMERARHDDTLRASINHGKPALAATVHAGGFDHGHEVDHHDADTGAHGPAEHHDRTPAHGSTATPHEHVHHTGATARVSASVSHGQGHHHIGGSTHVSHAAHPAPMGHAPVHEHHEHVHAAAGGQPMHTEAHREASHPQPRHMEAPHPSAPHGHSEPHPSGDKHHDDHKH